MSERPDVTQADIARATGAKPPSVSAWINGDTKTMKIATATKAAALYGVNPLWLSTGQGDKYAGTAVLKHLHQIAIVMRLIPEEDRDDASAKAVQALINFLPGSRIQASALPILPAQPKTPIE